MTEKEMAGMVTTVVDSLRGSPLIIGLLCMNALFLGVVAWLNHDASANRHDEMLELMRECRPGA